MTINEIIGAYTAGEKTLEETNVSLKEAGAAFHIDPEKNVILPEDVGRFGLLDTGTGSLDKVEVKDGRLVGVDCGEMYALLIIGGKTYRVNGTELIEA